MRRSWLLYWIFPGVPMYAWLFWSKSLKELPIELWRLIPLFMCICIKDSMTVFSLCVSASIESRCTLTISRLKWLTITTTTTATTTLPSNDLPPPNWWMSSENLLLCNCAILKHRSFHFLFYLDEKRTLHRAASLLIGGYVSAKHCLTVNLILKVQRKICT